MLKLTFSHRQTQLTAEQRTVARAMAWRQVRGWLTVAKSGLALALISPPGFDLQHTLEKHLQIARLGNPSMGRDTFPLMGTTVVRHQLA